MYTPQAIEARDEQTLAEAMSFDNVIVAQGDGTVRAAGHSVWAPSVYYDGDPHAPVIESRDEGWTLMNGYSGQQSYAGPIMHESEYIGGGLARDILNADAGTAFASVLVPDADGEITGWAVAMLPPREGACPECATMLTPGEGHRLASCPTCGLAVCGLE